MQAGEQMGRIKDTTLALRVGERLRAIREHNGWKQKDFAERLGITPAQLSRYESGKMTPNAETLVEMGEELHIIVDELLRGRPRPHIDPRLHDQVESIERLDKIYRDMACDFLRLVLARAAEDQKVLTVRAK